jgi:hypothetical protein
MKVLLRTSVGKFCFLDDHEQTPQSYDTASYDSVNGLRAPSSVLRYLERKSDMLMTV